MVIPVPEAQSNITYYDRLYKGEFRIPKQLIHIQREWPLTWKRLHCSTKQILFYLGILLLCCKSVWFHLERCCIFIIASLTDGIRSGAPLRSIMHKGITSPCLFLQHSAWTTSSLIMTWTLRMKHSSTDLIERWR